MTLSIVFENTDPNFPTIYKVELISMLNMYTFDQKKKGLTCILLEDEIKSTKSVPNWGMVVHGRGHTPYGEGLSGNGLQPHSRGILVNSVGFQGRWS